MSIRVPIVAAAVVVAAALSPTRAGQPAPAPENPYKSAKVGDFASYKMKVTFGQINLEGTITQTVTAVTDKEATVKVTANASGMDAPAQEQKIDLTKPFDPTKFGDLPPGTEANVTKGAEGKEKIKVGAKDYETQWTAYKVKSKTNGVDIDADVKVWLSPEVPLGLVKLEMTSKVTDADVKLTMELSDFTNKPAVKN